MGLSRLIEERPRSTPDTTVADAVSVMAQGNVGSTAILEDDRVIGIFTERDVVCRVVLKGRDPATTPLKDVMTSPVHSVVDGTSLRDATTMMRRHHMRHLPVVDADGKYLGMLALRHVHNEIMRGLERRVHDLTTWLMDDALGG
jgi:CBS domain-containing protein